MTDEQDFAAEDVGLEAPERGSADELLDAGAHSDLDAMRHSAAHVMAEAVLDLFPGTKLGIGPAIAGHDPHRRVRGGQHHQPRIFPDSGNSTVARP